MSAASEANRPSKGAAGAGTLLGPGTAFEGLLTFRGGARVDGELSGRVEADGTLVLGPTARVRARIEVDELILAGHLDGDVIARRRVAIGAGARLVGSVTTPLLRVEDGAHLEGLCRTGPGAISGATSGATGKPSRSPETAPNTPDPLESRP